MINMRVVLLVLLLLAFITFWWLSKLGVDETADHGRKPHEPDYYMQNFTQSTMNEQGTLHHRLSADMMLHYPDDDSTELVKPVLEVYNEGPLPWHVGAEKGWVSANNDVVLLSGAVHIWRDDAAGARDLDVQTRDLRVLPKDRYAETDKEATLTGRGVQYHSVGMRAIFKESRLELLSRVKGRHEPKKAES
ncbi:MAG: LPS export ABC transporter periplasmic protein LptC [Gammaproteobacteria bacterium]